MEFLRTRMLVGEERFEKLKASKIAVFGIGGVGGYVAEALVRSGVGEIDIIDKDVVDITNTNRQIIAVSDTVGHDKTEVMEKRLKSISPYVKVNAKKIFYLPETANMIDFSCYDYIVDAVDTVTAKLEIIMRAQNEGIPVISSMGTGNKLHPEMLEVTDIYKTSVCPLARVMRRELKQRGIKKLKVVYSKEEPKKSVLTENGRNAPASAVFVPACAGMIIAAEVARDVCGIK